MPKKLGTLEGSKLLYKDLSKKLQTLSDNAKNSINTLTSNLTEESNKRSADDSKLQQQIRDVNSNLSQKISNETATRISNDEAERAVREQAVKKLTDDLEVTKTSQSQVNADVLAAINSEANQRVRGDSQVQASVNALKSKITADLQSEVVARQSADTQLQNNVDAEKSRAETAEKSITTKLDNAKQDLQANIDQEEVDRRAADNKLASDLAQKEKTLRQEIADEHGQMVSSYKAAQKSIQDEATARQESDDNIITGIEATNERILELETQQVKNTTAITETKQSLQQEVATRTTEVKELKDKLSEETLDRIKADNDIRDAISEIDSYIPVQTSEDNQLADKEFVNSSITNIAAFFRGNFTTHDSLVNKPWQTTDKTKDYFVSNNDYAYVDSDETHNNESWRYMYVLLPEQTEGKWTPQFKINNSPLTQSQFDALNSGITKDLTSQIITNKDSLSLLNKDFNSHATDTSNPHQVSKDQVGLGKVDNTADIDKPVSSATKTLIDNVSNTSLDHIRNTNNPHKVTKEQIGLGNVSNTADADKPVSAATKTELDKQKQALDTHVGNVNNPHSVTKQQVGLGNVDNTSDAQKPVSNATRQALNQKADINSPNFTGIPTAPQPAANAAAGQIATVGYVSSTVGSKGLVSFATKQDLTDEQQYVARENIGAAQEVQQEDAEGQGLVKLDGAAGFPLNVKVYGEDVTSGYGKPDARINIEFSEGAIKCVGKNLISVPTGTTISGVTFDVSSTGVITASGIAAENLDYVLFTAHLPKKTYTLSGCAAGGSLETYSLQLKLYSGDSTYVTGISDYGDPEISAFLDTSLYPAVNTASVVIHVNKGVDMTDKIFNPQLEVGTVATSHEEYFAENASHNFDLKSLHGDVDASMELPEGVLSGTRYINTPGQTALDEVIISDTWENSVEINDKKYSRLQRRIKKLELGPSTVFSYTPMTTTTPGKFKYSISNAFTQEWAMLLWCNAYMTQSEIQVKLAPMDNSIVIEDENNPTLTILADTYKSADAFNTYITEQYNAGTPIVVYYVLKSPEVTLQKEVEFKGSTSLTTVYSDSVVSPYINAYYFLNIWDIVNRSSKGVATDVVAYYSQSPTGAQKVIARTNIGLDKVNNTADVDKPVSKATTEALKSKQDTIQAVGILQGSGSGRVGVAESVAVELVDLTPEVIGAQPEITAAGILKSDGAGNITAAVAGTDYDTEVVNISVTMNDDGVLVADKTYAEISAALDAGKLCVVNHTRVCSEYRKGDGIIGFTYVGKGSSSEDISMSTLHCTSEDVWTSSTVNTKAVLPEELTAPYSASDFLEVKVAPDNKQLYAVKPDDVFPVELVRNGDAFTCDKTVSSIYGAALQRKAVTLLFYLNGSSDKTVRGFTLTKSVFKVVDSTYAYEVYFTCIDDISSSSYMQLKGTYEHGRTPTDTWEYTSVQAPSPTDYLPFMETIQLPAAAWTGSDPYTQEVTIPIGTLTKDNMKVDVCLSDDLYTKMKSDGVEYLCIENDTEQLTFVAKARGSKFSQDITVQVICTPLRQ